MPTHKIIPTVNTAELSRTYIPRVSKPGYNQRVTDEESPLTEGKTEIVNSNTSLILGAEPPVQINSKNTNTQNSYANEKGGIYLISSNKEYPASSISSSSFTLPQKPTHAFPEGCDSSVSIDNIPLIDQGSTPYCALITCLSEISALLGITIDMQSTIHCGVVPCTESNSLDDFPSYDAYDREQTEARFRRDIESVIKSECKDLEGYEKTKCETRLRSRFSYLLNNPFLNVREEDLTDDIGRRMAEELHIKRVQKRFVLAMGGYDLDIAISCTDPEDQCPQTITFMDDPENCETECSGLCTVAVRVDPVYHETGQNISTNAILAKLCRGLPIMITLNSSALFGRNGRFTEEAIKYRKKYPNGVPEKFQDINLDIFAEPIIELSPDQDLIGGERNHAVLIDGVQILDNGYMLVRIRNSWGDFRSFLPQFYTIAIPPGIDLGKVIQVGSMWHPDGVVIGYRVNPTSLNLEEICTDCGESILPCSGTPTPTPTPSVTLTASITPTPSITVTPTVTPTITATPSSTPPPTPSSTDDGSTPTPSLP